MVQKVRMLFFIMSFAALLSLAGCASLHSYHPLPSNLENQVQMPGFTNIRTWGDASSQMLEKSAAESLQQERKTNHGKLMPEMNGLALSGGGDDGAFGAGLLCGWSKAGNRPQFKFVTGISTGALMAPFAFLGSAYDDRLQAAYTTISDKDIYQQHSMFALILSLANIRPLPSMADDKPLAQLIAKLVDAQVLKDVAAEHLKGRRLLIGTTQFNAQRLVIWDMGAIAASGSPQALDLFRKIMLASASLPATFPPQYFTVAAAGKTYQEMHVDGGIETEVMLFESALAPFSSKDSLIKLQDRPRNIYIIRNEKVYAEWANVKPALKYIAVRAINSLVKSQGVGDLYRLYVYAQRDQMAYNLAFIPDDFNVQSKSEFDNAYMKQLFARGFAMGKSGYAWHHYPPGFQP